MIIINLPEWIWYFLFTIGIAHVVIHFCVFIATLRHTANLKKVGDVGKEISDVVKENTKLRKGIIRLTKLFDEEKKS